jgi:enoyl-CoA hydratase
VSTDWQSLRIAPLAMLAELGPLGCDRWSPLSDEHYLLIDLRDGRDDPRLASQLAPPPCPVIGIGAGAPAIGAFCDVLIESPQAAPVLIANIEQAPMAAAVLVQVLRSVPSLSLETALMVESLAYGTLQAGREFRRWRESATPCPPGAPEPESAVVLRRQGDKLTIELNRPGNRNAMSVEMRDALCEALQVAVADTRITEVELSGRGRCFSTGGDLSEFGSTPDPATAHIVRMLSLPGRLLARCASRVTAVVHGACIGSGIEFPAFATYLVAKADAFFQLPELRYGLIPGAGGCVSVTRRIGRQRTAWLALSGRRVNARTALDWGLVDEIVE